MSDKPKYRDAAGIPAEVDYGDSQLSDAELAEHLERGRRQEASDAEAERRRLAKMRAFHFGGGM